MALYRRQVSNENKLLSMSQREILLRGQPRLILLGQVPESFFLIFKMYSNFQSSLPLMWCFLFWKVSRGPFIIPKPGSKAFLEHKSRGTETVFVVKVFLISFFLHVYLFTSGCSPWYLYSLSKISFFVLNYFKIDSGF